MLTIADRPIGPAHPPYVIAEMSGNHAGDLDRAFRLIDAAAAAGADAVKLQTYTADTITLDHDGPGFVLDDGPWVGRSLYQLYDEAHTPWSWHPALFDHARKAGITLFSSPFDTSAVDLLESLGAPAYKIASFELVDLPLIRYVAATGKPIILSTGMASLGEIAEAVATIRESGDNAILLLHCTSGYPTPAAECDLRTIPHLATTFDTAVGLSDHTMGLAVPIAAVALGAVAIEKHFMLARSDGGVDASFSLEAPELAQMVETCRTAWAALGRIDYALKPSEAGGKRYRRSLYIIRDIPAGAPLTPENLRSIRPGYGLSPRYLPEILGRRTSRALRRGEPLDWSMISPKSSLPD